MLIEFWSKSSNKRQPRPWDHRKVMMLSMVSNVDIKEITYSHVIICFKTVLEFIMFCYSMTSTWVKSIIWFYLNLPNSYECSQYNPVEGITTYVSVYQIIRNKNSKHIYIFKISWNFMKKYQGSKSIKKDLKKDEAKFPERRSD